MLVFHLLVVFHRQKHHTTKQFEWNYHYYFFFVGGGGAGEGGGINRQVEWLFIQLCIIPECLDKWSFSTKLLLNFFWHNGHCRFFSLVCDFTCCLRLGPLLNSLPQKLHRNVFSTLWWSLWQCKLLTVLKTLKNKII